MGMEKEGCSWKLNVESRKYAASSHHAITDASDIGFLCSVPHSMFYSRLIFLKLKLNNLVSPTLRSLRFCR